MKRIMIVGLAVTLATPAQAAERRYTVTDFERIQVEGPFIVTMTTGKSPSAVASGSRQAFDRVSVEVEGRTLRIRPDRSAWGGYPGEQPAPVEIAVTGHQLRSASLNGSGRLAIDDVEAMRFDAAVTGSGNLALGHVEADNLVLGLLGSGSMEIGGKVETLTAAISGSGNLDARALSAEQAEINADTAGTVNVTVTETAELNATGSGDTTIHGSAACDVKARGVGRIVCGSD